MFKTELSQINSSAKKNAHAAVLGGDYESIPAPGTALGALIEKYYDFKDTVGHKVIFRSCHLYLSLLRLSRSTVVNPWAVI